MRVLPKGFSLIRLHFVQPPSPRGRLLILNDTYGHILLIKQGLDLFLGEDLSCQFFGLGKDIEYKDIALDKLLENL